MGHRRPPEGDLARALCCAEAVLLGNRKEIEEFFLKTEKETAFIRFDKVNVSLDPKTYAIRAVKFLVAYAEDATFIAFRGPRDVVDIGPDYQSSSTSARKLHERVMELSTRFMGFDFKLLDALFLSGTPAKKRRIIFCGHRIGGAVAHMVVLRFWTEYAEEELRIECKDHPNTMISIAFEAPNFCHSTRAGEVNGDPHLKSHFFNCFVADDFLPHGEEGQEYGVAIGESMHLTVPEEHQPSCSITMSSCVPGRSKPNEKFSNAFKSAVVAEDAPSGISERPPNSVLQVTSPSPQVTSATRSASDAGIFITIKGYDLLFLREPVKLCGLYEWETKSQTDTELVIFGPNEAQTDDERNDAVSNDGRNDVVSNVVIKTAFGETAHSVLEGNMSGGAVPSLLKRIVQTFFILATPPLRYLPPKEVLEDLDCIVQCVQDSKDKKLSTLLKAKAEDSSRKADLNEELRFPETRVPSTLGDLCEQERKANLINDKMKEMNKDIEKVIQFLTRSYIIQYEVKKSPLILGCFAGTVVLGAGLAVLPVGGIFLAAGGAAIIATAMIYAGVLSVAAGHSIIYVTAVRLGKGQFMVRDYKDMLRIAIDEASLWHGRKKEVKKLSRPYLDNEVLSEMDEAALESLLRKEVECSGSTRDSDECSGSCLADKIKETHKSTTKDITLYSKTLKKASLDSKKNMLRRMQIVAKTVAMRNNEGIDFVGVVGEEDSGKSTFIKKAIHKFGEKCDSEDLPAVGGKVHTMTAKPYKLNNSLYLVDFPGGDGTEKYADAWKQFTSLPSSCILLLDYKNDIKQGQINMYNTMKKDLDSKDVTVVFNKVDQKFLRRIDLAELHAEYFTEQREKVVKKLHDCKHEDVHFVCLDPGSDPEELRRFTELKKVGVLSFEELASKVLGPQLGAERLA